MAGPASVSEIAALDGTAMELLGGVLIFAATRDAFASCDCEGGKAGEELAEAASASPGELPVETCPLSSDANGGVAVPAPLLFNEAVVGTGT
jgi:hypothetical protein